MESLMKTLVVRVTFADGQHQDVTTQVPAAGLTDTGMALVRAIHQVHAQQRRGVKREIVAAAIWVTNLVAGA